MSDSPPVADNSSRFSPGFALAFCALRRPATAHWAPALLLALLGVAGFHPAARGDSDQLPIPRYASLKSDEVNLRAGPGEDRPKLWVYQRAGMPVEIIEEFETWRRIRDYQGVVGWVNAALLSGRRTAIVTATRRTLYESADGTARPVAILEPGVIGRLLECNGNWCRLEVKGYEGWLKRDQFWGVFPDEAIKN